MAEPARTSPTSIVKRKRPARGKRDGLRVVIDHLDLSSISQRELDVLETYLGARLDEILRKMRT
ncbi:hypothetical protein FV242_29170 [Methylobacterium sp. WL64]|uniref:hypothetical protein n=1 Tax=Methylobacterium sp. WL64 TaxID=2603894 RepID=UPI0011C949FD|nr:hypothetical protein [Methylobacterium sp. WL64]TXM98281.1 hypothetical protein FV242_29170 [Methylobacterium sp. WL64]